MSFPAIAVAKTRILGGEMRFEKCWASYHGGAIASSTAVVQEGGVEELLVLLVGWLVGWLVGGWVGWLVGGLVGWLVGWLVGGLVGWLVGGLLLLFLFVAITILFLLEASGIWFVLTTCPRQVA